MMDHVAIIVAVVLAIVWRETRLHDERKRRVLAEERALDLRILLSMEQWSRAKERREYAQVMAVTKGGQQ